MPTLSVLSCNVYPGTAPVEFMLRNLAIQTFQDFELIFVDAFYDANAQFVSNTCKSLGLERVVHTPACEARHVGRILHWELYNNVLLLANSPWVMYFGMHRYMHSGALQAVAECAARDIPVVLWQGRAERMDELPLNIEETYEMDSHVEQWHALDHSGFFSARRDMLINRLNGWNEASVNHHWVDCDLSTRAKFLSLNVKVMPRALIRLGGAGAYGRGEVSGDGISQLSGIGKSVCSLDTNPNCVVYLINALRDSRRHIDVPVQRLTHNGFEWARCAECGTLGIEDSEAYSRHVITRALIKAPINVAGVGRNLITVDAAMRNADIAAKIELLRSSHTDPRFLVE